MGICVSHDRVLHETSGVVMVNRVNRVGGHLVFETKCVVRDLQAI